MTIENIRLKNARQLADEVGGQSRFAERVDRTRHLVSNYIGKTPTKMIGDDLARHIEECLGKPVGWLDREHEVHQRRSEVVIDSLDVSSTLGPGIDALLRETTVQQMQVSREWVRQHLAGSVSDYLAVTTVTGDSVGDVLPAGTAAVVDTGASSVKADGVYMLGRKGGSAGVWFRNVQRTLDGKFIIAGKGKAAGEPTVVKSLRELDLVVLGRVVATLELKKL